MICCVRDIPIYYEQYGEGKPILCIHGYSVDHRVMTGCLEPVFSKADGYRRIYLDLPGMGRSPSAAWLQNADIMLEVITGFINEILPNENFLLAGESYGGYLAMGLIHTMCERIDGALLICTVTVSDPSGRRLPEKCTLLDTVSLDTTLDKSNIDSFLNGAVIATPEIYRKFENDIVSGSKLADRSFISRYKNEGYGFSFEHDLKTTVFNKPVSILAGREDNVVGYLDAIEFLDCYPRATLAILDCAGHNLQIENEPLFNQHVRDWLSRVDLMLLTIG